jgi:hypothetical protein
MEKRQKNSFFVDLIITCKVGFFYFTLTKPPFLIRLWIILVFCAITMPEYNFFNEMFEKIVTCSSSLR